MQQKKTWMIFFLVLTIVLVIDQWVKSLFVGGFEKRFEIMSFILVYNKGVAFSMFAGLGEWLKYIQIVLLVAVGTFFILDKPFFTQNTIGIACILGGGIGNIIDRFMHIGVVDYIYWHWGFEFAIFNLADVFINCGVALIIGRFIWDYRQSKKAMN